MRILFVCCEAPDSPTSGSIIQTYHFLRLLRGHHVTGVWAVADPADTNRRARLSEVCDWTHLMPPLARRPMLNQVRWLAFGDPMARWGFRGPEIAASLDQAISEFQPDIVQFEQLHVSYPLLKMSRRTRRPRLIFNAHDALHVMLGRAVGNSSTTGVRRSLDDAFVRRVRDLEFSVAGAADAVFCVSETDAQMLKLPTLAKRYFVTPNGVDTEHFQQLSAKDSSLPPTLVFVGNLTYGPNTEAIELYANQIHPKLRARKPDLKFIAVGPVPAALEQYRSVPGVEFAGFQKEIRPYFALSDLSIVPLRSGSGTRFKILESWAMGRPVVSTTIGAEGLPYIHDQNILIADEPEALAAATLRLLDDAPLARRLAKSGRELVEREFSWKRIVADLRGHYDLAADIAVACRPRGLRQR